MCGTGKKTNQLAFLKRRADHGDVVQMPGTLPRVIGDIDITFEYIVATYTPNKVSHRISHRINVTGSAGYCLRQHLAPQVIDAR